MLDSASQRLRVEARAQVDGDRTVPRFVDLVATGNEIAKAELWDEDEGQTT